ncbi:MAG: hypothetical protein GX997_08285 [Bacteroidales bacterium]|nr:hypothetical protein [Bacteroidales bacterium]
MNSNNTFSTHWCYTPDNTTIYCYEIPSPNKPGQVPQPKPSATFPSKGIVWKPNEATSAGPVLIKDGEYKNTWEAEMFDEASGVGPTTTLVRLLTILQADISYFSCMKDVTKPNQFPD